MSTWTIKEKSTGELKSTVSGQRWKEALESSFNKLAKDVQIDGFRKGKAPKSMIKSRISDQMVQAEAVELIANEVLQEGIKEHNLWPVARPTLNVEAINNEEVSLVFGIIVKPEVTLGEYKNLKYEEETVEVKDEEVNDEIERMRNNYAEVVVKDKEASSGDIVVIDYEGFKDGVAFDGGKASGHELKLGSNSFIPGFEDKLIGIKANESRDIDLVFPENYHEESLKGQPVVFKVTAHEVKETVLPELNDDFAIDLNIPEVDSLESLKTKIKTQLETRKKNDAENKATDKLLDEVVKNAQVEVPQPMIEDETNQMLQEFASNIQQQGFGFDQFLKLTNQSIEDVKSNMAIDAENRIKLRLVLETIADKENLTSDEAAIEEEYKKIADQYKMEVDKVKELIPSESLSYDVKMRKALDFIKNSASK